MRLSRLCHWLLIFLYCLVAAKSAGVTNAQASCLQTPRLIIGQRGHSPLLCPADQKQAELVAKWE